MVPLGRTRPVPLTRPLRWRRLPCFFVRAVENEQRASQIRNTGRTRVILRRGLGGIDGDDGAFGDDLAATHSAERRVVHVGSTKQAGKSTAPP